MRFLILTADDFGLHESVNEAVERAHREGVLTCASLMVGAPAAADAVRRARCLPTLRVGLHLVLANGPSVLPNRAIPDLVDASGRFPDRMVRDGFRFFFLARLRKQLEREVRAQFDAFARTGLALDHVNAHKHFHLHPTVLSLILRIGRDHGLHAVRLPWERGQPFWLRPWLRLTRWRLRSAMVAHNDRIIGLRASGAMDEAAVLGALGRLESGVTEMYFHPATESGAAIAPTMARYRHADELAALTSRRVRAMLEASAIARGSFADLPAPELRLRALWRPGA